MNRPPVEQLRRLALAALVVVTLVLGASYAVRRWRAYQARRAVPAAIPGDVQQQAEKFTFSRSEEGRTLFTLQASRTIERAGKTTVLEDVVAIIYGRRGDRADEIRTGRCEYDVGGTGEIHCPGEVTLNLGRGGRSALLARPAPSIQLTTAEVRFDPARGVAWSDQPVHFAFPQGTGEAVGLRYQPQEPTVQLEKQVAIRLERGAGSFVQIHGAQLHYYASTQVLELLPPLGLQVDDRNLVADRVRMKLDSNFRMQRIEATGNVRARGQQDGRELTMRAPRVEAVYAADGGIEQLRASESVEFEARGRESQASPRAWIRPSGNAMRYCCRG